jgi:DNA-binding transcriptional LysR family regulator
VSFNQLDLNLLRVFDAVFQTRSVSAAASMLGTSQPGVSKQLNRLRELLHDPLFIRTTDEMAPTSRADALAGPVREALWKVRHAIESQLGFCPRSSSRTFRIYMSDFGQMAFLPKLLNFLSNDAPGVNIHTVQVPTSRGRALALESGEVDLAVGHFEDFSESIQREVLFEEHYVGLVRAHHPHIGRTVTLAEFLATPHLVYHPSGGGHSSQDAVVERAFCSAGVERRVALRVAHTMGLTSIVSQTNLLVVVPYRLARACGSLVDVTILALPIEIPHFPIALYWHERFSADPGNVWLRSVFSRLYEQQDPLEPATMTKPVSIALM